MKIIRVLIILWIGFIGNIWADVIPNECGYFTTAVSTRSACSSSTPGSIEFTGEANIYDNPSTTLYTCKVTTPQWVLNKTQTCESGDCEEEPGNTKSLSIDYTNTPSSASTSVAPSSSSTDETIDDDKTLDDDKYDDINFNYAGKGKTLTFEQSNSMWSSAKTLKVNTITSAWQILFKNNVDIKIGSITGATYGSPINIKTNSGTNINKISVDSMRYKENTTINLEAKDSIDIKTFEVGRSDSNVTLKAKEVTLDTLTVSNSGSGEAEITIIADKVNIGTLDMGQGAKVTILPYTSGNTVELKSNEIKASSNSELILSSGDYHTGIFNVPGTSNASSLRAKDSDQVVNFYINGDFKPGNNPGINSAGNNGDFGTLPAKNFRMFINGDLNTGGGGTTFNATIYTEDDATLGNPTYIKGALSANNKIEIGEGSKIYYSGDSADEAYLSCPLAGHDDICYETPITAGFNFGPVGFFTRVTTPIKNISDTNITNATVIKSFDGLDMSMMSKIKLDDIEKTLAKDGDEAEVNQGLQASFGIFNAGGIFNKGIVYRIDNFDVNQSHTIYDYSMFSFDMSKIKLNTIYTKNGKRYYSEIYPCGGGNTPNLTGSFDAWDTFRDNTSTPPTDRNISTKVVNNSFKLSLASLNKDNDAYEMKRGIGVIDVAIYKNNSTNAISNHIDFNATTTSHLASTNDITVTSASKNAVVGFKLCATYENNTTLNEVVYYLYPSASCNGQTTLNECNASTNGTPTWHICYSTDNFAIRPNKFSITNVPTSIKAGKDFNITIKALDGLDVATKDYNETLHIKGISPYIDYNETKATCKTGILNRSPSSSVKFVNGEINVTLKYSEVGDINLTVGENNDSGTFAYVDQNDTNISQLIIKGDSKIITVIPHHFEVNATLRNFNNDNNFTYISKDLNMSAILDVNITAQTENNTTTQNYNTQCYAKSTDYNISYSALNIFPSNSLSKIKYYESNSSTNGNSDINNNNIQLHNINKSIFSTDDNGTAHLIFHLNFDRNKTKPVNPFQLNIQDINVSDQNNTFGTKNLDKNATFFYGQVNAGKQRYVVPTDNPYNANIHYQIYCFGATCNTALLPSTHPVHVNDIRWYKNTDHNTSNDGNVTAVTAPEGKVNPTALNNATNPTTVDLPYDGTLGYPYSTTIEVNASNWLIYNEDNANATTNSFQVEYNKAGTGWSGKRETNTTTKETNTTKTNGRTMW